MKFTSISKTVSPLELALVIIFVLYLALPIETPALVSPIIDSSIGYVVLFCLTVYMFFHTHPVLGVLFVFVAYELIRRSSTFTGTSSYIRYTPSQPRKDKELKAMNPVQDRTLEEDVVEKMAPISGNGVAGSVFQESTFKPVSETVHGASMV